MSLRDGMHPKRHQITLEQMVSIATGLDEAGMPLIEVTHGDGLGGASVNYGFPAHTDEEYLKAVVPLMKQAKVSALLLPGIGTVDHLRMARDLRRAHHPRGHPLHRGGRVRAAHRPGAQAGHGHRRLPDDGAHEQPGEDPGAGPADGRLRRQLHLRHRLGRLHAARRRDRAPRAAARRAAAGDRARLPRPPQPGMGVANSLAAIEAGANRIDGSVPGLGAGAGNTPLEVFVAVCDRMGIETGVDLYKIMDVAEDLVVPMMDFPIRIDRDALTLGYAGRVLLLPAVRQARREVRRVRPATSWSSWAGAAPSAARKT
jgi:4-hydroxy-2-oxovalerate/4-hydroxy-2-oxohexanoate aldolase